MEPRAKRTPNSSQQPSEEQGHIGARQEPQMRAIIEALCTLSGKHQDENKEREGAGRTTGGG